MSLTVVSKVRYTDREVAWENTVFQFTAAMPTPSGNLVYPLSPQINRELWTYGRTLDSPPTLAKRKCIWRIMAIQIEKEMPLIWE